MNRVTKLTFAATACLAITGASAFADDPPAGGGGAGVDVSGGAAAGGDPNAAPPAGGAMAPTPAETGGSGGAGSKTIGADAIVVLPFSDYSDAADLGVGAFGRFEFGINDMLSVTGRVGALFHIGTPEGVSVLMIPIFAGAKYKIGTSGLFVHGEAGINIIRTSIDIMGTSASDTSNKLSFGAGAGYTTGKITARAGLFITPDVGEGEAAVNLLGILGTVGYDFAAL